MFIKYPAMPSSLPSPPPRPALAALALAVALAGSGPAPAAPAPRARLAAAGLAAVRPSIQVQSEVQCGAVIPGSPQGFLVLNPFPIPGGSRTATPPLVLAEDASVAPGGFTLSGRPGARWTLSLGGPASVQFRGPQGPKPVIPVAQVTLGPGGAWTGSFPPGPGPASSTPPIALGLTVQVPALARDGLYTALLPLELRDGDGGLGRGLLMVSLQVDRVPMTLSKTADLAFGSFLTGSQPGRVVLAPGGAETASGGVTLIPSRAGPAGFLATGTPQARFSIALPASATLAGPGGHTLTATDFTCAPGPHAQLDAAGQQPVRVGATLEVAASQAPGAYSGSFIVSVVYD